MLLDCNSNDDKAYTFNMYSSSWNGMTGAIKVRHHHHQQQQQGIHLYLIFGFSGGLE